MPGTLEETLLTRALEAARELIVLLEDKPFSIYLKEMEAKGFGPALSTQLFREQGASVKADMTITLLEFRY